MYLYVCSVLRAVYATLCYFICCCRTQMLLISGTTFHDVDTRTMNLSTVHLINVDWGYITANPRTKPTNLGLDQ